MALAAPVQNPDDPEQELLRSGYVLEEPVIQRMAELGIASVYVTYPKLHDLNRHLEASLCPARKRIYVQIKETLARCQKEVAPDVNFQDYYSTMCQMLLTLLNKGRQPIFLDQMASLNDHEVGHAATVAHLCLLLGIRLEHYLIDQRRRLPASHAKEVVNLGIAGMMHDIGKTKLPAHLQNCNCLSEIASESDRRLFQSHSRLSYEMVRKTFEVSAANAVLHHHQHYDGGGYPRLAGKDGKPQKMMGPQIHVFARILHVADLFERLSYMPEKKQRRPNLETLFLMRTKYAHHCDPIVLQTLHAITPPYPPGCKVGLSDGTHAVVTAVGNEEPFKPVVKRLGEDLWSLDDKPINLRKPGMPSVVTVAGLAVEPFLPKADAIAFVRA